MLGAEHAHGAPKRVEMSLVGQLSHTPPPHRRASFTAAAFTPEQSAALESQRRAIGPAREGGDPYFA